MRVLDSIKAVDTGQRRAIIQPLHSISLSTDSAPHRYQATFAREYSITVVLGANQWIAEELIQASGGEVVTQAITRIKRAIADELYGELRRDLLDLSRLMYNELNCYDSESTAKLVKIMEKISL